MAFKQTAFKKMVFDQTTLQKMELNQMASAQLNDKQKEYMRSTKPGHDKMEYGLAMTSISNRYELLMCDTEYEKSDNQSKIAKYHDSAGPIKSILKKKQRKDQDNKKR